MCRSFEDFTHVQKLLADASSLIILEKSGALDLLLHHFELFSIQEVKTEVLNKNKFKDEERYRRFICFFDKVGWCGNQGVTALEITTDEKLLAVLRQCLKSQSLSGITMLTDDKKMIKRLYQDQFPFINALLVPVVLCQKRLLSLLKAQNMFNAIRRHGRYNPGIVEYAFHCLA